MPKTQPIPPKLRGRPKVGPVAAAALCARPAQRPRNKKRQLARGPAPTRPQKRRGASSPSQTSPTSLVECIDLGLVLLDNRRSLQLHCCCKHVILGGPLLIDECNLGRDLESNQLVRLALLLQLLLHRSSHLLVSAELLVFPSDSKLLSKLLQVARLRADQRNRISTTSLAIDHGDRHQVVELQHTLNLGQSNVLTLRPLPEILLTVDDLQLTLGCDLPDITSTEVSDALDLHPVLLVLSDDFGIRAGRVHQVPLAGR
mmetsp:Transcript_11218/g.26770  ORF Transcript_11218/g.26770 Transcript_11218/m.26770 type:complete len:258 (+) Transcript_11218:69-842(+)